MESRKDFVLTLRVADQGIKSLRDYAQRGALCV
jgi:hypothetical protein